MQSESYCANAKLKTGFVVACSERAMALKNVIIAKLECSWA